MVAGRRVRAMAENRARLIHTARAAFAKDHASAFMDALTAVAGLTRGALYHSFGDKKGLLRAVIGQPDSEMVARARAACDRADTPCPVSGLLRSTAARPG